MKNRLPSADCAHEGEASSRLARTSAPTARVRSPLLLKTPSTGLARDWGSDQTYQISITTLPKLCNASARVGIRGGVKVAISCGDGERTILAAEAIGTTHRAQPQQGEEVSLPEVSRTRLEGYLATTIAAAILSEVAHGAQRIGGLYLVHMRILLWAMVASYGTQGSGDFDVNEKFTSLAEKGPEEGRACQRGGSRANFRAFRSARFFAFSALKHAFLSASTVIAQIGRASCRERV